MNFRKAKKVAATAVVAAAGVLVLGAFGSPALAAENTKPAAPAMKPAAPATGAIKLDPRCDCLPGPAPLPEPAPAPEQPAPEQPAPTVPSTPAEPAPNTGEVACPAQVPSNPTGADYVNAWNLSGTCLGAGAAGLVSSAWAGAIPSIVQGAAGSLSAPAVTKSSTHKSTPKKAPAKARTQQSEGVSAPVVVPSNPTGADYVNAWNQSGALAGGGAAGLVSSAWAGAIPSIVQGALSSLN